MREIVALEAKGTSEDEEAEDDARELRSTRQDLDKKKEAIAELEKFYDDVKARWGDIELRNIGHFHYSPSISVDVEVDSIPRIGVRSTSRRQSSRPSSRAT